MYIIPSFGMYLEHSSGAGLVVSSSSKDCCSSFDKALKDVYNT
ncbi:unnamed protein product [Meloidogyne enterolobii]|uniref:Uncharacterized protein n=1 Tax=Meloidogyne enterolobii TaxID=390850 RepID=A0ACB1AH57_MELEN